MIGYKKKGWKVPFLWLWNFSVYSYWIKQQLLMMLNCVFSKCGTKMCQNTDSTDYFWWIWTALYYIMEATDITCSRRKYLQELWTMYGFTHIVCATFADVFTGYFLCTCIFVYTFYLLNSVMNKEVNMNPLLKYIYRESVSACA